MRGAHSRLVFLGTVRAACTAVPVPVQQLPGGSTAWALSSRLLACRKRSRSSTTAANVVAAPARAEADATGGASASGSDDGAGAGLPGELRACRPSGSVDVVGGRRLFCSRAGAGTGAGAAGDTGCASGGAPVEVPVVVVGAGPVGLALSLLLAKYGIRHVVLERALGPTQHPQAHFINNRTMEVFRGLGLSAPVRRRMPPLEQWRRFVYCESVAGRLYGDVDHFPGQSSPLSPSVSPEPVAHLPQHTLLRLMLARQQSVAAAMAAAAATAGRAPLVPVLGTAAARRPGPGGGVGSGSGSDGFGDGGGSGGVGGGFVSWGAAVRGVRVLPPSPLGGGGGGGESGGGGDESGPMVEVEVEVGPDAAGSHTHQHAAEGAPSPSVSSITAVATAGDDAHAPPAGAGASAAGAGAPRSGGAPPPPPPLLLLRCRYLVAADGAHSTVRALMGGRLEGSGPLQHLINVHFRSRALGRAASGLPAMLYFVFNPEVVAVLVAHDIDSGEFVAQIPFFPPLQSPADFPHERLTQLIRAAAGQVDGGEVDVALLQVRPWVMSAQVADRYAFPGGASAGAGSSRSAAHNGGVVFLAGDSAHRFPPAGGFGMNTGVQDAAGLAWRLAAVLRGLAGPGLLSSYEAERRPVAQAACALSVRNWGEATRVPAALGLDPSVANAVSDIVAHTAPLPQWARKTVLEGLLQLGRRLAGPEGLPLPGLGAWRTQTVQRILRSGASLRLQYPAEDLGYVYDRGAVVVRDPGATAGPPTPTPSAPEARLPTRGAPYNPSSAPGCRLPHCWLTLAAHPNLSSPPPVCRIGNVGESGGGLQMLTQEEHGQEQQAARQATQRQAAPQQADKQQQEEAVVLSTLDVVADSWVGPRLLLLADGYRGGANPWLAAAATAVAANAGSSSASAAAAAGEGGCGGAGGAPALAVVQVLQRSTPASGGGGGGGSGPRVGPTAAAAADDGCGMVREPPEGSVLGPAAASLAAAAAPAASPAAVTGPSAAAAASVAAEASVAVRLEEAEPGGWARTMGLPPGSCLLVRPDGHVAWRHLGPPRVARKPTGLGARDTERGGAGGKQRADDREEDEEVAAAETALRGVLRALHWRLS